MEKRMLNYGILLINLGIICVWLYIFALVFFAL